jgi:hypothetical protein
MRSCGSCNVCCEIFAVPEIHKMDFQRCPYIHDDLVLGGCSIYSRRPRTCRVFHCGWLREETHGAVIPLEFRPDRAGIVFTWLLQEERAHGEAIRQLVALEGEGPCALEVWNGAASVPENVTLLTALARSHPVYVASRERISVIHKTGGDS